MSEAAFKSVFGDFKDTNLKRKIHIVTKDVNSTEKQCIIV